METVRNEDCHFVPSTPSLVCKLPSDPPSAAFLFFFSWRKKPKLFNLLWNETFRAFAGCAQEELISLSSKSSFICFSLIHFLRGRKALTQVGWEPQEFLFTYLEFPLFPAKNLGYKVDILKMEDYGFKFWKTSQDLMIPQVVFFFLVDFAEGSVLSRMRSNTKQSQGLHVGILTESRKAWKDKKWRCGGQGTAL